MFFHSRQHQPEEALAEESKNAIKTTSPCLFYTKDKGVKYEKGVWKEKHEKVEELSKLWKGKLVRVRVELPESAPSLKPSNVVGVDTWGLSKKAEDVKSEGRKDVMIYLDKANAKVLFGKDLKWAY